MDKICAVELDALKLLAKRDGLEVFLPAVTTGTYWRRALYLVNVEKKEVTQFFQSASDAREFLENADALDLLEEAENAEAEV